MQPAKTFETRFPNNAYSCIPKTLIVAALVYAFTENGLLTMAAGMLLHIIPNAYDCKIVLAGSVIKFHYFRPWFNKEVYDLRKIVQVVIEPEQAVQTLKDIWYRSDGLWPIGGSKLLLYGKHFKIQDKRRRHTKIS